jgi:hypothetical protein
VTPRCTLAAYLWVAPVTGLGLLVALVGGMRVRSVLGVFEASGGWLGPLLRRVLRIDAITLGHAVIGVDTATLARWRHHERVHVWQYERLGVLMPLMYGWHGLVGWCCGRRAYWDHPYEVQARQTDV